MHSLNFNFQFSLLDFYFSLFGFQFSIIGVLISCLSFPSSVFLFLPLVSCFPFPVFRFPSSAYRSCCLLLLSVYHFLYSVARFLLPVFCFYERVIRALWNPTHWEPQRNPNLTPTKLYLYINANNNDYSCCKIRRFWSQCPTLSTPTLWDKLTHGIKIKSTKWNRPFTGFYTNQIGLVAKWNRLDFVWCLWVAFCFLYAISSSFYFLFSSYCSLFLVTNSYIPFPVSSLCFLFSSLSLKFNTLIPASYISLPKSCFLTPLL